jgi:hypothetical protein
MKSCRHDGGGGPGGKRRAAEFRSVREYSSGAAPLTPAHFLTAQFRSACEYSPGGAPHAAARCPNETDRAEHDPKAGGNQHQANAALEHEAGVADKAAAMPRKIRPHCTADQSEHEGAGQSQFQPVHRAVPDLRLAASARFPREPCCVSGPFRARGLFRVRLPFHARGPFRLHVLFRAPGWVRVRRTFLVRRPLGARRPLGVRRPFGARGLFRAGAPAIGRARVTPAGRFAPGWRYRE